MDFHPSKRRKVEHGGNEPAEDYGFNHQGRERARSLAERREKLPVPKLVLPAHHAFGVHGAYRQKTQHVHDSQQSDQAAPQRIQARQLVGTQVSTVPQAAPETASTVLAIAVDSGQGIVSEIEVPTASKSAWIPGYGVLTMTNGGAVPTVTATPDNTPTNTNPFPGAVTPLPAVAAAQARNQALQTQEAIAKQLNVVPQEPSSVSQEPPNAAQTPSVSAPAPSEAALAPSQSPMTVNTPESHSQQVLASPPTPVPATPQLSAGSSTGPATSYFSSSPASIPNSSPPRAPTPSATSQYPSLNNPQLSSSTNSTLSATTLSSSRIATSSSLSSVSSEASLTDSSSATQSTASQASSSDSQSLTVPTSTTRSPSGFSTSTLSSPILTTGSSSTTAASTLTTLSSSASSSSTFASTSTSTSSQSPTSSASGSSAFGSPSSTNGGAGIVGGPSNTVTSASPTSTSEGGSSGDVSPPASVLAGGIVGGVAGATILALIVLLFFRWRRARMKQQRTTISPPIPQTIAPGGVPQTGNMTQRSSTTPIAGAGFFGRLRPVSAQTATTADTAPSERGFQKISGRKLPSVLASGGDGYGDNTAAGASTAGPGAGEVAGGGVAIGAAAAGATTGPSTGLSGPKAEGIVPAQGPFPGLGPASPQRSLSGASFYRDSHGFYGGVVPESTTQVETDNSSTPSTSPSYPAPLNISGRSPQDRGGPSSRQPEVAITRPGPARTPVINEPGVIPIRTPSRANQPPSRPARATPPPPQNPLRDALGRSHPSQDGSRGSRFREDTTPP